jgi:ribosome-associated protein
MSMERSRAQRRRDDQPRHDLARRLITISAPTLARLPLEEAVREAVAFAASRTRHGAHRREVRHLAAVLRELDDAAFAALQTAVDAVAASEGSRARRTGFDEAIEIWADDLLAEESSGLERLRARFPELDTTRLRQLLRNCRKEQQAPVAIDTAPDTAPAPAGRARARLLRYLSELMDREP